MTYYAADFETTVYEGQDRTDVWLAGFCALYTEEIVVKGSISEFWDSVKALRGNVVLYFHNLKFDGSFLLYFLVKELGLKQALKSYGDDVHEVEWIPVSDMENNTFRYSISSMGQWYNIIVKVRDKTIEFRDSMKLVPGSIKGLGKAFQTKHQKTEMEYEGYRYPNCPVSEAEMDYFKNDIFVLKEVLEYMFDRGHSKLTIGSCCLAEFKEFLKKNTAYEFEELFPNLVSEEAPEYTGCQNVDEYIRKSYHGGWCYLDKGKEGRVFRHGLTLDVNSLYPYVMHSKSGNAYPVGHPSFWKGEIPQSALQGDHYYFLRIKCRFRLKEGKLPCIQIKNSFRFKQTEYLRSSEVWFNGNLIADDPVILHVSKTKFELIQEQYDLFDLEVLDGCWFYTMMGLFDDYIDYYKEIKMNSKGALRTIAKLFSNNLYGKLATSDNSSFKVCMEKPDGGLGFMLIPEHNKRTVHIGCGAAVTSYAAAYTIRTAQLNYYGPDRPGFIYADTDSIHCDLSLDEVKGVTLHDSEYGCWKAELEWEEAIYVRQKTNIERGPNGYVITCAGMPDRSKELLAASFTGVLPDRNLSKPEEEFLMKDGTIIRRTIEDFKPGIRVPGKLMPKRIPGGIVLQEGYYEMQ